MLFQIIFLLLVFGGICYSVFHGEDIHQIAAILHTVHPVELLYGTACVVVFIWGESIIIYYMMRTLGIKLKKWTWKESVKIDQDLQDNTCKGFETAVKMGEQIGIAV